jgi:hypothetical protein
MYNRYVDGLATGQPRDEGMYAQIGRRIDRRRPQDESRSDTSS